ncbi:DUF2177 family protein [Desulfurivibrio alkaliphilus]|uniref:DUF2177 family protein n=1 Tax=Desulfurivibrio alkaliphilus (strain DSM 19089 / UNIQEM U267 / AHT2) TaxID=589865 RepID=D6Z119_DESAT|nr:DUF2177 family protein [Desulfurivibrio alkaliphilus]ADH87279.1 Protein of unknown function DUF2177, membrane [Desulfurivibrio alkaliphilus AHT 2]
MDYIFYLKLYLVTVPIFFMVDMLWLGLIARKFYRKNLGFILSPEVNWLAALTFYFIFIVGIIIFAVNPAIENDSLAKAMVMGGLFGFFTYATYDLTNMALIKGWPLKVVLVDIAWGAFLCATVASLSFTAARWLA